jgi:hypothetical protein
MAQENKRYRASSLQFGKPLFHRENESTPLQILSFSMYNSNFSIAHSLQGDQSPPLNFTLHPTHVMELDRILTILILKRALGKDIGIKTFRLTIFEPKSEEEEGTFLELFEGEAGENGIAPVILKGTNRGNTFTFPIFKDMGAYKAQDPATFKDIKDQVKGKILMEDIDLYRLHKILNSVNDNPLVGLIYNSFNTLDQKLNRLLSMNGGFGGSNTAGGGAADDIAF